MSRSYKKHPVVSDDWTSKKLAKRWANKKLEKIKIFQVVNIIVENMKLGILETTVTIGQKRKLDNIIVFIKNGFQNIKMKMNILEKFGFLVAKENN